VEPAPDKRKSLAGLPGEALLLLLPGYEAIVNGGVALPERPLAPNDGDRVLEP
jgi:hypothetical protein